MRGEQSKARVNEGNQAYSWYSLDVRWHQLTGIETRPPSAGPLQRLEVLFSELS